MAITYLVGDATTPNLNGRMGLLVHVCNDRNGFGRGFVVALTRRWPTVKAAYHQWHHLGHNDKGELFKLGEIQCVRVEPNLFVCNMIAQAGYGKNNAAKHQTKKPDTTPPIRYDALERCLEKIAGLARELDASVHMPRIGCGLGGSSWEFIEPIVVRQLSELPVTVYDYAP